MTALMVRQSGKRGRYKARPITFDRQIQGVPFNGMLAPFEVVDPDAAAEHDMVKNYRGEWQANPENKSVVSRSIRDDPLGRLHARGQVEEAEYRGGRKWQRLYEAAEIGSVVGIDPAKDYVDGRRFVEPFNEKHAKAMKRLAQVDKALGNEGAALVRDVLGNRLFIIQVAIKRGYGSAEGIPQRDRDYLARRFRECLASVAIVLSDID